MGSHLFDLTADRYFGEGQRQYWVSHPLQDPVAATETPAFG
jgi:hypothetical protein